MDRDLIQVQEAPLSSLSITQQLLSDYVAYLDAEPATVRTYAGAVRLFIQYLKEQGITQPQRDTVIAYREHLKTYCKATTVQNYLEALKIFFRWTAQEGLYPNIAEHIKGAKITPEHKKDYLTAKQLRRVLAGVDLGTGAGLRDYALLAIMITGGLRDIELHRANIEDLSTHAGYTVLYLQGKGRQERAEYVKVPADTEAALRAYLKARRAQDPAEALFISLSNNSLGQRLSTRSISSIVKKYLKKAGYDSSRLTAHSLRHSAITLSIQAGNTLQEAQQFARHRSINTTLIYAHNLQRADNNCEESIAAAVFKR